MPQTATAQAESTPSTPLTQSGTQLPAGTPVTVVKQHSFATFSFLVTLLLVLTIFFFIYFYVRRREHTRHVDQKAGDEGED